MRNIIIIALAILSLTACTREEINNTPQSSKEITFGNSFVAYTTKAAEITKESLTEFKVWGIMNSTSIYAGNTVRKSGDAWRALQTDGASYDVKYWIPGQYYNFAGIAPTNSQIENINFTTETITNSGKVSNYKLTGDFTFTNTGELDLIFSSANRKAINSTQQIVNEPPVELKFQHILSKVRVSFTNKVDPYIDVEVSNVRIKAQETSTYSIEDGSWSIDNASTPAEFTYLDYNALPLLTPESTGSTESLFLIPSNKYEILFDVTLSMIDVNNQKVILYNGANKTASVTSEEIKKITPDNGSLQKGYAYNFKVNITPQRIVNDETFEIDDIEQEDWEAFDISSQISVASKLGGTVTLTSPLEIPSTIDVVDDLTINLNGYTLTYTGTGNLFNVKSERETTNNTPIDITTLIINGTEAENDASSIIIGTTEGAGCIASATNANSEIIINGGNHTTTLGPTVYSTMGGKIKINAGVFTSKKPQDVDEPFNLLGFTTGQISINGGSFYQWDPANNSSENNYLADGLMSAKIQEYYVVGEPKIVDIPNTDDKPTDNFKDALKDPFVTEVNLGTDTDISTKNNGYQGITINHSVNINGDGTQLITSGGHGYKEYAFYIQGAPNVTINDLEISGAGIYSYGQDTASLLVNNCIISQISSGRTGRNIFYIVNTNLTIKDTEIRNDHQSHREIYAVNCTVTIDGGKFTYTGGSSGSSKEPSDLGHFAAYSGTKIIINEGSFYFNPIAIGTKLNTVDSESSIQLGINSELIEIKDSNGDVIEWKVIRNQ